MRTLVADAPEMPGVIARSLRRTETDIDRNPRGAQPGVPLPGHFRVGILDRRYHAFDAGGDHGIRARRRLADMRTRFQRHVERGTAGGLARTRKRDGLGVRTAAGLVSSRARQ